MFYDISQTGQRIKTLRRQRGMTQDELSEKLGVSNGYLSRVERGTKGCSVDMFVNLSEIFDVSLDYLISGKVSSGATEICCDIEKIIADLTSLTRKMRA